METDVDCPDCGKVIAPPGAVDDTLRCRCAEPKGPSVTAEAVPLRPSVSVKVPLAAGALSAGTNVRAKPSVDADAPADETPAARAAREKKCYICGRDLTGKTRLKDHLGRYWCKQCAAKDEQAKKQEEEGRCPDCSRVFPADKLVYFQVTKVCKSCFKEREKELEKKIKKAAAEKLHQKAEWQSIKWLAIAAGALILTGFILYLLNR
ncbi:MAG TPA: hypothetical protein VER17_09855 [Tepidisphaeraceae bacterium]|nr:hypothetical protein [Tepidisphaeraceae bacterium]